MISVIIKISSHYVKYGIYPIEDCGICEYVL